MRNIYVAILGAAAILFACTENKTPEQHGIEKLSFTINKLLLGPEYKDIELGFSFSPPLDWDKMPQEMITQAREKIKQMTIPVSNVKVELRQFFLEKVTGSSCVLSKINGVSLDSLGKEHLQSYTSAIASKFPENTVKQGLFSHKDFFLHQILIMSESIVTFKLVFPQAKNNSFQLDYVIPRSQYEEKLEAIESSIGSIEPIE